MPTEDQIVAQARRHGREQLGARSALLLALRGTFPNGIPLSLLSELNAILGACYQLGRNHTAEVIQLRLGIAADTDVVVVQWEGEGCPGPRPHAHLRFTGDDEVDDSIHERDLRN